MDVGLFSYMKYLPLKECYADKSRQGYVQVYVFVENCTGTAEAR